MATGTTITSFKTDIKTRYLNGESCELIAKDEGCNKSTINKRLRMMNVPANKRGIRMKTDIKKRYLAGETLNQIAEDEGCRRETIWKHLEKMGVKKIIAPPYKQPKQNLSQIETNKNIDIARLRIGMKPLKEYRKAVSYEEHLKRFNARVLKKLALRNDKKRMEREAKEALEVKNNLISREEEHKDSGTDL